MEERKLMTIWGNYGVGGTWNVVVRFGGERGWGIFLFLSQRAIGTRSGDGKCSEVWGEEKTQVGSRCECKGSPREMELGKSHSWKMTEGEPEVVG